MKILNFVYLLICFFTISDIETFPEARDHHAMAFDSSRNKVILFGGNGNRINSKVSFHNAIWEWNGLKWEKPAKGDLEGRSSHVLFYNPLLKETVLFGGVNAEGLADNSMNSWNGAYWKSQDIGPSSRYSPAIAFDEKRNAIVLFSGAGNGDDEMWEFKDNIWKRIKLPDTNRPSSRARSQMAYDYIRETIILFGGYSNGASVGDTWEWNGSCWIKLEVVGPGPRNNHTMVSDKKRKRIILFGGKNRGSNVLYNDTWEWDGSSWEKKSESGPQARGMTASVYDEILKKVLIFGGRNIDRKPLGDFWSWDGNYWTKIH